ncbi:hypothetical protein GCM10027289_16070 [Tsukamurella serpentis]
MSELSRRRVLIPVTVACLLLVVRGALQEFRAGNVGWGIAFVVGVVVVVTAWIVDAIRDARASNTEPPHTT